MGDEAVEDGDAVDGEDAGHWWPRATAITAMASSRPATRIVRIRVRRVVARAGWLWVTPPFKAAWCCRHVCGFRYAGDMRRLVASEDARVARRGRAVHGRRHPRRPTPGSDRGRHRD